ncbi:MAG: DUF2497 domain-containing protein [Alphaproteobacteria bacterium]|nr:DUF2497 domain-containing protein [Alphaproteobacteria bacterium]
MAQRDDQNDDMSMEEILASIRRYVVDETMPSPGRPEVDRPEIQQPERGEVIRLTEAYEVARPPQPPIQKPQEPIQREPASSTGAFSRLAEVAKKAERQESAVPPSSSVTVDHLFAEIARPMIKQWLDKNLPDIVETMVNKEIERITKSS